MIVSVTGDRTSMRSVLLPNVQTRYGLVKKYRTDRWWGLNGESPLFIGLFVFEWQ